MLYSWCILCQDYYSCRSEVLILQEFFLVDVYSDSFVQLLLLSIRFWFAKHYSTTIATESRRTRLNQPVHLACPAQRRAAADDPVRAGE